MMDYFDLPNPKIDKCLADEVIAAVKDNNVEILTQLRASGESLSLSDKDGNNLLHLAIQNHSEKPTNDAFEYLLTLDDVPKNAVNFIGYTPLMEAFGCNDYGKAFAINLIKSGCDIESQFPDGNTALHLSVYNKWIEVAELLIELGFDVDCQNADEETALHIAARTNCIDIIYMLLFFGADPNITFTAYADYIDNPITLVTFFDILINKKMCHELPDMNIEDFGAYKKYFSLMTFMQTMESEATIFYKLVDIASDINYTYDDLKTFSQRIFLFNPKMFKVFVQEFPYVVEDMFHRCCLDGVFFCGIPFLENYCDNLFTLIESHIGYIFIDEINSSSLPLLVHLIDNFAPYKEQVDILTQLLLALLSYGVNMTAEAINEIYLSFGHCNLFKMMLHMEIHHLNRCLSSKYLLPRLIYDMNVKINYNMIMDKYDEPMIYKMAQYFTLPNIKFAIRTCPVPTLVEIARNASRQYIINTFNATTCMKFYTVLKRLPIAELHKKIISFERKLYY